jgi:acyl-coenzyme A synthetase/AMP-(fatty) acid ligase
MKIYQNGKELHLSNLVNEYKKQLKNNKVVKIFSDNPREHIACFLAWKEVGGIIFVQPTDIPFYTNQFDKQLENINVENSIILTSSGTTGIPKFIIHPKRYFEITPNIVKDFFNLGNQSSLLTFVPVMTSAFWHMFMPAVVEYDCKWTTGNFTNFADEIQHESDYVVIVPPIINIMLAKNIKIDGSKYEYLICGSTRVTEMHSKFMFDNSIKNFIHAFGQTESGVPTLYNVARNPTDATVLNLTNNENIQTTLIDNELCIKGNTLCSNIKDFGLDDNGWYHTGDLFYDLNNGKIKFDTRINDVVKVNGYRMSLSYIESIIEQESGVEDCVARIEMKHGIEYLVVDYIGNFDKNKCNDRLKSILPKYCIPSKYIKTEKIAKSNLGKKIRQR